MIAPPGLIQQALNEIGESNQGPFARLLRLLSAGGGGATYPAPDNIFAVAHSTDLTKQLIVDAAGQAPSTKTTITLGASISRPFRLPDISGTALVCQDATAFVFINSTSATMPSNAGIQYSIDSPGGATANRAQLRTNLFGSNNGAPGITGFKSRGPMGTRQGCLPLDVLWRIAAKA